MNAVDEFHRAYYASGVWSNNTRWMGVPVQKCPLDAWIYQEIIFELKPALIIETGTCYGGSALYFAHLCDLLGRGQVMSIDIAERDVPQHPRILYVRGSSVSCRVLEAARFAAQGSGGPVMAVLDSNHDKHYVREELGWYADFVTPESYLVVEDVDIDRLYPGTDNGGPFTAVEEFLACRGDFEHDRSREKFLMTSNAWLKRKAR